MSTRNFANILNCSNDWFRNYNEMTKMYSTKSGFFVSMNCSIPIFLIQTLYRKSERRTLEISSLYRNTITKRSEHLPGITLVLYVRIKFFSLLKWERSVGRHPWSTVCTDQIRSGYIETYSPLTRTRVVERHRTVTETDPVDTTTDTAKKPHHAVLTGDIYPR